MMVSALVSVATIDAPMPFYGMSRPPRK